MDRMDRWLMVHKEFIDHRKREALVALLQACCYEREPELF